MFDSGLSQQPWTRLLWWYRALTSQYFLFSVFSISLFFWHRSPFCKDIVSCRGDHVRLAVRVRVFTYPENACAVWLMFACKYCSVLWSEDTLTLHIRQCCTSSGERRSSACCAFVTLLATRPVYLLRLTDSWFLDCESWLCFFKCNNSPFEQNKCNRIPLNLRCGRQICKTHSHHPKDVQTAR